MGIYEGMFLLNAAEASRDWDALKDRVTDMIVRHGAEIKRAEKWAERKLAYDIAGQSKGVYLLVFFESPPGSIDAIRGDCRLQRDYILREIILRKDESALSKPTFSDAEALAAEKARRMMSRTGSASDDEKSDRPKSDEAINTDGTGEKDTAPDTSDDENKSKAASADSTIE